MTYSAKVDDAAHRFFCEIIQNTTWHYTDHPAKQLILAAFHLYERAWDGGRWDVRNWEWPFHVLKEGQQFTSDQPWAVLLRRAVELTR